MGDFCLNYVKFIFTNLTDRIAFNKKKLDKTCLAIQSCVATSYPHRGKTPTTIGAKKLNFCVRHGNRCILLAIATTLFYIHSKLVLKSPTFPSHFG